MEDFVIEFPKTPDEFDIELKRHYLNNRTLVFNREVAEDLIEDYVLYILKWNADDKDVPVEKRKPITIYMSSIGGSPFYGGAMISAILQSKTPVRGFGMGIVASACFDIYLACSERIAMDTCVFLMHDGGLDLQSSSKKVRDTVNFVSVTMAEKDKEFVLSRTNMDEAFYDAKYGDEFYMYADKAKELGVVHKIVGVDCDLDYVL